MTGMSISITNFDQIPRYFFIDDDVERKVKLPYDLDQIHWMREKGIINDIPEQKYQTKLKQNEKKIPKQTNNWYKAGAIAVFCAFLLGSMIFAFDTSRTNDVVINFRN